MACNEKNKTGAAITEAVLVIPVLLLMLLVVYQIYRAYLPACNAVVAARTEIMLESVRMNANEWKPFQEQDRRSEHEEAFMDMGLFPGTSYVHISKDLSKSNKNWLEKVAAILTGSSVVNVEFELAEDSLVKNFLDREKTDITYIYTGTCAVDPWAVTTKRFFGFLEEMMTNIFRIGKPNTLGDQRYDPLRD